LATRVLVRHDLRVTTPVRPHQWAPSACSNVQVTFLQRTTLFDGLTFAECAEVASTARERHFSRRQTIFHEGEALRSVFFLISGHVKMTQHSYSGVEVIQRLNGQGEVVGTVGFPRESEYVLSAQALDECHLFEWDAMRFESLEERFPTLRRNAMLIMADRLGTLEERFVELATEQVANRLARILIRLCKRKGSPAKGPVRIDLSQEELAQMIGTTVFSVCRILCTWEQRAIIQTKRKAVLVRNSQQLIHLTESDEAMRSPLSRIKVA
jgi:CRP-like cAMP-binding protein